MIKINDLSFGYKKEQNILNKISLNIDKANIISILGKNGVGKTTFIKCLLNELSNYDGEIHILGKDLKKYNYKELAKLISYVPQRINEEPMLTFDSILLGKVPYINFKSKKQDLIDVEKLLKFLDLEHLAFRHTTELSGGEFQKVKIARALIKNPKIILLDEPTNNLDLKTQIQIMELLKHLHESHKILVLLTIHDLNLALRYSDKIVLLKDGMLNYFGKSSGLSKNLLEKAYDVKLNEYKIKEDRVFFPYL